MLKLSNGDENHYRVSDGRGNDDARDSQIANKGDGKEDVEAADEQTN